jgi:hypothetical protein
LNDGTGIAISPDCITSEQFEQIVGQAWESSSDRDVKSVRTAVGLIQRDPTVGRLLEATRHQDAQLTALRLESGAWQKQIAALKAENAVIRHKNSAIDARLSAIELRMKRSGASHGHAANRKNAAGGGRSNLLGDPHRQRIR